MIVKQIFYGIKCDRCGSYLPYGDGDDFEESESQVISHAECAGWQIINGKHCCLECWEQIAKEMDEVDDLNEY